MPDNGAAPTTGRVLVVADDVGLRGALTAGLEGARFDVRGAESGPAALATLDREAFDVIVVDLALTGTGGITMLGAAPSFRADAQIVALFPDGAFERGTEAVRLGARLALPRESTVADVIVAAERACMDAEVRRELARLRVMLDVSARDSLVGRSPASQRLRELVHRAAGTSASVLLSGEPGSGKELVARTIHALSERARRPFVAVDCGALDDPSLDEQLFGRLGEYGGARAGLLEEAAGGTLLLDHVSAASPSVQARLARVLRERTAVIPRSGMTVPLDFRVVATSRVDLAHEVAAHRFRADLHARIAVLPIDVPALRDRLSDIPLLANHFRARFARDTGTEPPAIPPDTMLRLLSFDWPGNVRQLEHFIERAMLMHAGARGIPFDLPAAGAAAHDRDLVSVAQSERWTLERLEREYILRVLDQEGGHQSRAADLLGIDRRTLYRKLKQYRGEEDEDTRLSA